MPISCSFVPLRSHNASERAAPEARLRRRRRSSKSDRELVRGCLNGGDDDWNLLIDKYKNLIFSIPIRYGLSREEAADIFQMVCLDLIQNLPKVKDAKALAQVADAGDRA